MEIRDLGEWHAHHGPAASSMTTIFLDAIPPCIETAFCDEIASHADRLFSRGLQAFRSEPTWWAFKSPTAGAHRFEWHKTVATVAHDRGADVGNGDIASKVWSPAVTNPDLPGYALW